MLIQQGQGHLAPHLAGQFAGQHSQVAAQVAAQLAVNPGYFPNPNINAAAAAAAAAAVQNMIGEAFSQQESMDDGAAACLGVLSMSCPGPYCLWAHQ